MRRLGAAFIALLCWGCLDRNTGPVAGTTSETTNSITLTGRVLGPDGMGAAGSRLSLRQEDYLADTASALPKNAPPEEDGYVDSSGYFRMDSLPAGTYLLSIRDGAGLARLTAVVLTGEAPSVDIGALSLLPSASYSGLVVLPSEHAGAAYVQVVGTEKVTRVDSATGRFNLPDMPSGPVSMRFTGSSPALEPKVIRVEAEPSLAIDLGSIHLSSFEDEDYSQWPKSLRIRFDSATVAGLGAPVADFPLLVRLGPAQLDFAGSDGTDIRFSGPGGEHLRYQVQFWDAAAGKAAIWVLMNEMRADTGQSLTMHWGKRDAADWSKSPFPFGPASGFAGIWHLDENSPGAGGKSVHADASTVGDAGEDHVQAASEAGVVGAAQRFLGADSIKVPVAKEAMLPRNAVTVSAWVNSKATDVQGGTILNMGDNYGIRLNPDGGVQFFIATGTGTWIKAIAKDAHATDGLWHLVTGRFDGTRMSVHVDGVRLADAPFNGTITYPLGHSFFIGAHANGQTTYDFFGLIDEVRVDNRARSDDWIKLRYANERPDSHLLLFE